MLEIESKRITEDLVLEVWGMVLQQYINEEEVEDAFESVNIIQEQRNEIMQIHKEKLNEFIEIYLERQNTRKGKKTKANRKIMQGGGLNQNSK